MPAKNLKNEAADFAAFRGGWIEQGLSDGMLSDGSFRTLTGLAHHFLNRETRKMWASQETMARTFGISKRTLQGRLAELIERGHLRMKRQGRDKPNLYFPVIREAQKSAGHNDDDTQETAHHEAGMTRKFASYDAQDRVSKTRKNLRTNPLKEPFYEHIEGDGGVERPVAGLNLVDQSNTREETNAAAVRASSASGASTKIVEIGDQTDIDAVIDNANRRCFIRASGFGESYFETWLSDFVRDEVVVTRLMDFLRVGKLDVAMVLDAVKKAEARHG